MRRSDTARPSDPPPEAPSDVRVVGRRRVRETTIDPATDSAERVRQWRRALPTPFVPRGVYRFRSHEEADEWMWKMIARRPAS